MLIILRLIVLDDLNVEKVSRVNNFKRGIDSYINLEFILENP